VNSLADNSSPVMSTTIQAKTMSRRDFIAIMGVTGVAAWLAVANVLRADQTSASANANSLSDVTGTESPTATSTTAEVNTSEANPTSTPTATQTAAQPTQVLYQQPTASACSVRCNHRCSYPGHCGRYYDSNNNGYCDNGECM
jgi:secreted PhoX family phosphatase